MINEKRMLEGFLNLIKYDSLSFQELDISIYLLYKLKSLGLEVEMDNAGHLLKDNPKATGNIYGYLKGNVEGEGIILSSHMDTVSPGIDKKAIIENGIVKSLGDTILGADDVTGIVEILEVLTVIKEHNLKHPDIEVIFFIAEEAFCKGSSVFDFSRVKSKYAYILDLSGRVGTIAISAPTIISFKITIHGKASHAGFEPEKGVSAILAYANVVSKLKLGRIDDETTMNIGTVEGGTGKNTIPDLVVSLGEIRGMDDVKINSILNNIKNILDTETKKLNATYEFEYEKNISSYHVDRNSYVVKKYEEALESLNYGKATIVKTFGGSDNNNFNLHGIVGVVLSNAMQNIHTKKEYFEIDEFVKSARILLELLTTK